MQRALEERPSLATPTTVLDTLFDPDPATRADAAGTLVDSDAEETPWRATRVQTAWTGADGAPAGRALALFDTPGALRAARTDADADGTDVSWTIAGTTEIWRSLVELFPVDSELRRTLETQPGRTT